MSDYFKATYDGRVISFGGWDGYVAMPPSYRTLTLQTDGHGTLTATTLTGLPGDTVTLTPTYNTYYRFNNYSVTGGTIAGNTFTFGNEDATAQANFKVNAFTATGGFEKGSNVAISGGANKSNTANVGQKYAIHNAHTGNVPTAWYSASNRWKVPSDVSAYSITLKPAMKFTTNCANAYGNAAFTAQVLIGSTVTGQQTKSITNANDTWNYTASITKTNTNVLYSLSGKLYATGKKNYYVWRTASYIATGTTGTWTATGIAP